MRRLLAAIVISLRPVAVSGTVPPAEQAVLHAIGTARQRRFTGGEVDSPMSSNTC